MGVDARTPHRNAPERRIELPDGISDGAVEDHAITKLWQVDIRAEPVGDLADPEMRLIFWP